MKGWIRQGRVEVSGVRVFKATHPVAADDWVRVHQSGELQGLRRARTQDRQKLKVVMDDSSAGLLVIEKPPGLLSVSRDAARDRSAQTLLSDLCRFEVFPCHRLDRETSGLLMFATHRAVQKTIFRHWGAIQKTYHAYVHGKLKPSRGRVNLPLVEHPKSRDVRVYHDKKKSGRTMNQRPSSVRDAVTYFQVLKHLSNYSQIEFRLETGRKHQIRVHAQALGHPIVGDPRYAQKGEAKQSFKRMYLHAAKLEVPENVIRAARIANLKARARKQPSLYSKVHSVRGDLIVQSKKALRVPTM